MSHVPQSGFRTHSPCSHVESPVHATHAYARTWIRRALPPVGGRDGVGPGPGTGHACSSPRDDEQRAHNANDAQLDHDGRLDPVPFTSNDHGAPGHMPPPVHLAPGRLSGSKAAYGSDS